VGKAAAFSALYHSPLNRTERIFRLHALRNDKPRPLARLQEELDTSRATVVRDLAYMKDFMGAPSEYDRATNGYRYRSTEAGFQLPGLWLNESELYALLASERLLEQMQPGLLSPYVGPLRSGIRAVLAHSGHSAASVSERILMAGVGGSGIRPLIRDAERR
jgi:predicted DNA-binding transcriptional regulator YafY